jgi:hypothetical protein
VAAAAVAVVGVTVTGGRQSHEPSPIELVAQDTQAFPLSFTQVPAGLTGPQLSLDPSFEEVGPGAAHAGWSDPDDPDSGVGISVRPDEPSTDGDTEVTDVEIAGHEATVYRTPVTGSDPFLSVTWERSDDEWVTVTGSGRFATADAVTALARQVTDRATPVPLQLTLAPRGWVLVAYKDDRIVTVADPAGAPATDATARTLSDSIPRSPSDPADLSQEVTGGRANPEQVTVHDRPAYLLSTPEGAWFLQAQLPDGTVFVLQAPGDLSRVQLVEIAEGVTRP